MAYSRLIQSCLFLLRLIKNPSHTLAYFNATPSISADSSLLRNLGLFRYAWFQSYSAMFRTLEKLRYICPHSGLFWQIQEHLEPWHS